MKVFVIKFKQEKTSYLLMQKQLFIADISRGKNVLIYCIDVL